MSFSSFSNVSSGVMFGFAVDRKDFGQVRFVSCSSNSCIECLVFAILFSTVLWSVYFHFWPRFGRFGFGRLLGLLLVGGRFSLCPFGRLYEFRVGLGCDGGGLFSISFLSSDFSISSLPSRGR